MAQIDVFVRNMWRLGANGVVMVSGANVTMKLPSGDRFAAQNTPHAQLVTMVEEIATEKVLAQLRRGQSAEFPYTHSGSAVRVRVDQVGKSWRVEVTPLAAPPDDARSRSTPAAAAAPASAIAASGSPSMSRIAVGAPSFSTIGVSPASLTALAGGSHAPHGPRSHSSLTAPLVTQTRAEIPVDRGEAPPSATAPTIHGSSWLGNLTDRSATTVPARPSPSSTPAPPPRNERLSLPPRPAMGTGEGNRCERLLRQLRDLGGSDLHLTAGQPPAMRVDGEIRILTDDHPLTSSELLTNLMALAPEANRSEFSQKSDTDFAYDMPGVARFRINVFRDRRGPCAVARIIPFELRRPADLGLSNEVLELCQLHKGLVLVTGPTGSGKSTTLATLIDQVNETRTDHIITIEDPIEFVHDSKRCLVHQREVGPHTRSFRDALRAALREDPDVLLVGELRDLETMAMAVETAETGHLVFGTLHTSTAASTVERLIDQFPGDRQDQIRQMLSESLRAVIAQTLCRRIGGGRVAAYEILFNNGAVGNLIRERKTHQLASVIQTGKGAGMVTLNDSLAELVRKKVIDPREAINRAVAKSDLRNILARDGFRIDAAA